MTRKGTRIIALALFAAFAAAPIAGSPAQAARLKDIASIEGVRSNQLIGYGLVVGLQNTGDKSYKTPFTIQTLLSMLERMGTTVDVRRFIDSRLGVSDVRQLRDVRVENVAAVMVTADLPPFARQGSRIDVTVSSLGDARSLKGGTLILTPLKAPNGEIYAVAQGAVSVGGAYSERGRRASETKNHPTVARITSGAVVEKEVGFDFSEITEFDLAMHNPDFTTTQRAVNAINASIAADTAKALDSGTIRVSVPAEYADRKVELVAAIESLDVETDSMAKVVLDERTGTVIIGENVKISRVAVSHGNLTIRIEEKAEVSQPEPLAAGQTVVVPRTLLTVEELGGKTDRVMMMDPGVNIGDMVKALNAMGVTPRDLIAIFQSLKAAGALDARLEII